jgi:hypothetical protein
VDLTLTFEDNGTAHNDLVLRLGDLVWRCDSYFLALDDGVLPGHEDAAKVRAVLRALLQSWRVAITGLANGATAYLSSTTSRIKVPDGSRVRWWTASFSFATAS